MCKEFFAISSNMCTTLVTESADSLLAKFKSNMLFKAVDFSFQGSNYHNFACFNVSISFIEVVQALFAFN